MDHNTLRYEIISSGDNVLGEVWWDEEAEKISSDNPKLLDLLKKKHYNDYSFSSGKPFLQSLGKIFNNGYLSCKKVKQ